MQVKISGGNKYPIYGKRYFILLMLILFFTTANAQDYMYSTGYHVNTDVTGGMFYDGGGATSNYGANDSYTVTFIAPAGYNLVFNFTSFLIVNSGVLSIYNGLSADPANKIGDFDYNNPIGDDEWDQVNNRKCSPYIFSSGRALTFVFNANGTTNGSSEVGWIAEIDVFPSSFSQININEISGQTIIYEGFFFDDGGFEDRYSTTDYTTTFAAPIDHILSIEFYFYDITGSNDKLDLYDDNSTAGGGSTRLARLQGNTEPVTYYSTGQYLTIDWTAKQTSPTIRGWVAKIEVVSVSCGTYDMTNATDTTDCGLFFDSGGSADDFSGSDNLTHTFCSNNGLPLTFNFYDYEMGSSTLNVYDGPTTSATQLEFNTQNYLDESIMNDKYITSSDNCLTFEFIGANPKNRGWASKIVTQQHVSNNDACDATSLPVNAARQMESYNNIYATQSMSQPSCLPPPSDQYFLKDVWFYIITPDDGFFSIDIEASDILNMGATLYSGSCSGSLTEEDCEIADEITFTQADIATPTPGDTLFVRVWGQSGEAGSFNIGAYEPLSISCTDANYYEVTTETDLSYVEFNNSNGSFVNGLCGAYSQYNDGVAWYKIAVPESQELLFMTQLGSIDDINFAVFSACGASTSIICNNDAEEDDYYFDASAYSPGDTLWVVYWGGLNNNANGSFQFAIVDPEPEGNGPCGAELVNVSGEEDYNYYNNTGADDSGEADPGCSWTSGDKDMWFKFIAPADGKATVKTVGSSLTDIAVAIYSGTCSSLSLISCNTSNGSGETEIQLTGLPSGDSIFVRVWGVVGFYGMYGLSISAETPDGPCEANQLTVQEYSSTDNYNFQGYATTNNTATPGIAMPGCGTSQDETTDIDIWFKAVVPESGGIGFLANNISMPVINMALYNGDNCNAPSYIDCENGTGTLNIELNGRTAGDTIRVRIWADYAQTGYFEIAAYEPGSSLSIVGLDSLYCYSETVSNNNIVGSPLGGDFIPSSGVLFKDNSDGTGVLYIGGDSTQWGDHTLKYALSGDTVTGSFRVAPSYLPTTDVDTISICDGETPAAYTASGAAGATFYWFDTIPATDTIYTGATYTPSVNSWTEITAGSPIDTLNYYVVQEVESCVSDTTKVFYLILKTPSTGPQYHIENKWGE